jgi:hypothetical protein
MIWDTEEKYRERAKEIKLAGGRMLLVGGLEILVAIIILLFRLLPFFLNKTVFPSPSVIVACSIIFCDGVRRLYNGSRYARFQ